MIRLSARWFGIRASNKSRRKGERPRLAVESLEDRTVPSTFNVTTLADSGAGSLRQAIADANTAVDSVADTITFDSRLHGRITLASELPITDPDGLTISGPGAGVLAVSGNDAVRVFDITSTATATISGLTITRGLADKNALNDPAVGGGVLNFGTLTLCSVVLSDNHAIGDAGTNPDTRGNGFAAGGGVGNRGTLNVFDSTFTRNQAIGAAESNGFGTPSFSFPGVAAGGAIANYGVAGVLATGTATITDSHFTDNLAQGRSSPASARGAPLQAPASLAASRSRSTPAALSRTTGPSAAATTRPRASQASGSAALFSVTGSRKVPRSPSATARLTTTRPSAEVSTK